MEESARVQYPKFEPTLVRYEEAVEIPEEEMNELAESALHSKKKQQLQPLDQKWSIEDILNKFYPPRKFQHEGGFFKQKISLIDVVRDELKVLENDLDQALVARQARKSGICPIREDLHSQLFDEIIRQSTINCPERGLLLIRVWDNLKLTFAAYQTLYAGSVVFGTRKALQSEIGKNEQDSKIQELEKKKIHLENQVLYLFIQKIIMENELDAIQRSFKEIRELEEKKKEQEITFLKHQTKHLESFLKQMASQN